MAMSRNGETIETAPAGYRRVDRPGEQPYWIHEVTGLCVDLLRYARMTQMHDPQASRVDHHEHQLVIRPDGRGEPGAPVDRTTEDDHAVEMAREWMRSHPDGTVDLEAEQLEEWER